MPIPTISPPSRPYRPSSRPGSSMVIGMSDEKGSYTSDSIDASSSRILATEMHLHVESWYDGGQGGHIMPYKDPEIRKQKAKEIGKAWYEENKERNATRSRRWHEANHERHMELQAQWQARRRQQLAAYKLERGCAVCGYKEHPAALHFDHLPG